MGLALRTSVMLCFLVNFVCSPIFLVIFHVRFCDVRAQQSVGHIRTLCAICKIYRFCRPPGFLLPLEQPQTTMGTERCNNCTTVRETKDLKRCTNCK